MMTKNRTPLLLILAAVFALPATGASAQIDPRFVLTGDAAANIGETNMINSVTAVAVGEVIKTPTKGFVSGLIDSEMRLKHLRSVCR